MLLNVGGVSASVEKNKRVGEKHDDALGAENHKTNVLVNKGQR